MRNVLLVLALLSVLGVLILPLAAAQFDPIPGHEGVAALAPPDMSCEAVLEPCMAVSEPRAVLGADPWNLRADAEQYHVSRSIPCDDYGLEDHEQALAERDRLTEIGSVLTTPLDPDFGRNAGPN